MITCTRRLQFAAGHRVLGHEGKCAHPHGHNYVVLLEAEPLMGLDNVGRVIDFSVLKERLGGWIEEEWDHGFILYERDEALVRFFDNWTWKRFLLPYNPTAENIAKYLLQVAGPVLLENTDVQLSKVTVWETENCMAVADQRTKP